jgi:hypothetical protein
MAADIADYIAAAEHLYRVIDPHHPQAATMAGLDAAARAAIAAEVMYTPTAAQVAARDELDPEIRMAVDMWVWRSGRASSSGQKSGARAPRASGG